jgi:hypothetical protein
MTTPIPSCIPTKNGFMATIKTGAEETIIEAAGRRLLFVSSSSALRAAQLEIESQRAAEMAEAQTSEEDPVVAKWKADKARERDELRAAATLFGVEVVRKKRRVMKR